MLWIRISFQCPDPDPGSQTDADPCGSGSWSDFKIRQLNFNMKNIGYVICQNTYLQRYKSLFERQETRFIGYFWSISMLLDPDPQYGSGSRTAKPKQCGIHNTDLIFNADHCCDRSESMEKGRQKIQIKIASLE